MKRTAIVAAILASTTLLTACQMNSDDWHVGHCAAGQLSASGQTAIRPFMMLGFKNIAVSHGLSFDEMAQGFDDYVPGT